MSIFLQEKAVASVFLGFCVKEYWPTPADWKQPGTEVCSVSSCIASRPDAWIERWDFNFASCWNTEEQAWDVVAPQERERFRLYAYRVIPLLFTTSGTPEVKTTDELFPDSLPPLPSENALQNYSFLGYDVVQGSGYLNYGCSPLSCNGMAVEYPVNWYYLIDDLTTAMQAATTFGHQEPEPGPFLIFEVWRKQTMQAGSIEREQKYKGWHDVFSP